MDPAKLQKSVSFADERNETHLFIDDLTVEPEEIWYIGDDYTDMKMRSRYEAKEWRKMGFGILLQECFALPRDDAQHYINAFVLLEGSNSRRGLERSLSRRHGEERSELKDRARQSVLIHQRRLQREGMKYDDMAEKLAAMYREVCRAASIFARRLGMADELVVKCGEDSSLAERIVDAHHEEVRSNRRPPLERRLSNFSVVSTNSFDSKRRFGDRKAPKRCPSSPSSPSEEFYAAIA